MFVNGTYQRNMSNLGDLGCGCQAPPTVAAASGGFDFSQIPTWAWIAAAAAGAFLLLKKK